MALATGGRRRANTRQVIYDAAVAVIAELGYHSATTDAIAHEAGVSVGTIYNYFRSKEEILASIFEQELSKRLTWLRELRERGLSAREALKLFLDRHRGDLAQAPEVGRILLRERSFARDGDPAALKSYMEQIPLEISRIIQDGQARGQIRPDVDARLTAGIIFAAMEGIVTAFVEGGTAQGFANGHATLEKILWGGLDTT